MAVRVWDLDGEVELFRSPRRESLPVTCLAFSPGSRLLAWGERLSEIHIWDVKAPRSLHVIDRAVGNVNRLAFSPDGKTLISDDSGYANVVWDVGTGKKLRVLPLDRDAGLEEETVVTRTALSLDGKTYAEGRTNGTVRLMDVSTGREITRMGGEPGWIQARVRAITISRDGKQLAAGGRDMKIRLWDLTTGKLSRTLEGHEGTVLSVAFSPDGKTLVSGGRDESIRLWDLESGEEVLKVSEEDTAVTALAYSPDGKAMATGSASGMIRLWDLDTGKEILKWPGEQGVSWSLAFSLDGRTLASAGSTDSTVRLWSAVTGEETGRLEGHRDRVLCITLSPDGKTLASGGSDRTVRLWEMDTGQPRGRPLEHDGHVFGLAFASNGRALASACYSSVRLQSLETPGDPFRFLEGLGTITAIASSPDGMLLAAAIRTRDPDEASVRLVELATGREIRKFGFVDGEVRTLALCADGKALLAGTASGLVGLLDLAANSWSRIHGHEEAVFAAAFSPDGSSFASGSGEGTVLLWETAGFPRAVAVEGKETPQATTWDLWADLAEGDAPKAFDAILRLAEAPEETVVFLQEELDMDRTDPTRMKHLMEGLDHVEYGVREEASKELAAQGARADAALREALKRARSPEVTMRIKALLQALDIPYEVFPSETLRRRRSVQLLEWMGTEGARRMLERLAGSSPSTLERQDARAALERLRSRVDPP